MLGVYRIDNRFRSNAALKARYPISDPIFIGSDRTAKNSDSVTISDTGMRGGKMEIQVMVLPKEHAFLIIHLFTLPTRAEGRAERHPPPLEARRSYRMWGASLSDPTTDPITDLSELPIRYQTLMRMHTFGARWVHFYYNSKCTCCRWWCGLDLQYSGLLQPLYPFGYG